MITAFADKWAQFEDFTVRIQFTSGSRIELYEGLIQLLENNVPIKDVVERLYDTWSNNGKDTKSPLSIITKECMQSLEAGDKFSDGLTKWIPMEESAIIFAGEKSGKLVQALESAVEIIESKQAISTARKSALVYPIFVAASAAILLWLISEKMIPQMTRNVDPNSWTGSAYLLYSIANITTNYGLLILTAILGWVAWSVYSLPRSTGRKRLLFDHFPIFGMYKVVQGSTFLLNVSVMMQANIPLLEVLDTLKRGNTKYMTERINGIMFGVRQGSNLGVAMEDSGYNFPSKTAIQFITILAGHNGFEESLKRYSKRWLKKAVKEIEERSLMARNIGLALIAGIMMLVILGTQEMADSSMEMGSTVSVQH
ncbi:type II secretion system F family protein [Pseudomonas sp. DCB_CB]|uniref:type II secretion system F family protein n=1 Tax=unclassified Pseudomonas TaxID=196821 RepID=UPI002248D82B|nr:MULTISPECIES: type II secretion system F family protein [unclassified Pseudomonas]MCX2694508.1 type II secretion system F family protein [Pseudomonas sp. DCB_BZ]MCX2859662.1 type II secretion system F family protein [Pseudomonas sp. DCB_CB]